MGIVGLMTGAGAGQGIQEILKMREAARMMALRERAQTADEQRNATQDQWQRQMFERTAQRQDATDQRVNDQNFVEGVTESNVPGNAITDPATVARLQTLRPGLLKLAPMEQRMSPLANEEVPDPEYTGTAAQRLAETRRTEDLNYRREAAAEADKDRREMAAQRTSDQSNLIRLTASLRPPPASAQPKPATGAARAAVKYFDRMKTALEDLASVDEAISKQGITGQMQAEWAPNMMQNEAQQVYNQALNKFTEARLRKDSGAAVPPSEYAMDRKVYGIKPGDGPKVIAQKLKSRADTARALAIEAGDVAMAEHYGDEWRDIVAGVGRGGAPKSKVTITSIQEVK